MTSTGRDRADQRAALVRDERGAGGVRNLLVTLVTVAVVGALAVLTPSLLPGGGQLGGGQVGRAPAPDAGRTPDTPVVRTADGGTYRFAAVQRRTRSPVAYPRCEPLRFEVNLAGASDPAATLRMILDAARRIGEATGLTLQYAGTSERRPEWDRGEFTVPQDQIDDPPAVLVSLADAAEVPQLQGQVAGIAGSVVIERDGVRRYLTGQVTLDSESFRDLAERPDGDGVAAAITLHEFGHLVGLDHVEDRAELMYAVTTDQRDLGPGDLAGLRRLGRGAC